MDVKPVLPTPAYRINASQDTREDGARRERGSREEKKKKDSASAPPFESAPSPEKSETKSVDPDPGQWIDSGKVVELLSHRPSARNLPSAFKKLASPIAVPPRVSDGKKLDKLF